MMRREDWPERLAAFLDARRYTPFDWALNNCASFTADAVEAMTGDRPLIPEYASERAAARLLATRGLRDRVNDAMAPEIGAAFARRGDVVMFRNDDDRETLGVCEGAYIAAPGADGLVLLPMSRAVAAWRV